MITEKNFSAILIGSFASMRTTKFIIEYDSSMNWDIKIEKLDRFCTRDMLIRGVGNKSRKMTTDATAAIVPANSLK